MRVLFAFFRWLTLLLASILGAYAFVVVVFQQRMFARDIYVRLIGVETFRTFEDFFEGPGEWPVWAVQGALFVLIGYAVAPSHRPIVAAVLGAVCIAFTVMNMVGLVGMSDPVPVDPILEASARVIGAVGAVVFAFLRQKRPAASQWKNPVSKKRRPRREVG